MVIVDRSLDLVSPTAHTAHCVLDKMFARVPASCPSALAVGDEQTPQTDSRQSHTQSLPCLFNGGDREVSLLLDALLEKEEPEALKSLLKLLHMAVSQVFPHQRSSALSSFVILTAGGA